MGKITLKFIAVLVCILSLASAQAQEIRGVVKDKTGLGLPGANVRVVERAGVGTVADLDGYFQLTNLKPGSITLEFSFIGYETQLAKVDLAATGSRTVDITLVESINQLDEAVVVGYGVQRKRDVTGSIVSLSSKDITETPTQSFESSIQGKAPGVQVITGSGLAGSASVIRIRGIASISAGGDPLYVIDGIPITQDYFLKGNGGAMNNNPLASINPQDIESMEILKDAAATAIYGSRGANGVILITTKRGKKGALKFGFSTSLGFSKPTKRPNMLNAQEYLQLYQEAWVNDGNVGTPTGLQGGLSWAEANRNNTDWVDNTIGTGFKQNYDFNVQKGTKDYNFYAGVSYSNNESYLIGNSYTRFSGRLNGDYRFSDKLKVSLGTSLSQGINNRIDAAWSGGLGAAMSTALPYFPIYWDKDVYRQGTSAGDSVLQHAKGDYWLEGGVGNNPVAVRDLKTWRQTETRSISTASINYAPIKNLNIIYSVSYDFMNINEDFFYDQQWLNKVDGIADSALSGGRAERYPLVTRNFSNFLTGSYDWQLNDENSFTFLLGSEYQQSTVSTKSIIQGDGLTNTVTNVSGPFYENADLRENAVFDSTQLTDNVRFLSFFGRVNYKLKNKYLVQLVLRSDGSSKFGPDERYGFFPSFGLGWIMSEEEWLKRNRYITFLKLKTSIGFTGNASIPTDSWRGVYQRNGFSYNGQAISYIDKRENPDLRWEDSRVFDVSLQFGLFQDRITGEIAYYNKFSSGVFIGVELPRAQGFGTNIFTDNIADILNTGVEFQIKSNNVVERDFSWSTNFNIAYNYNEIVSLGGYTEDAVSAGTNDTRAIVGQPVGTNYLVRFAGVDPENGRPVYLDIDGQETYDWDPADRVPVGSVLPDAVGGIGNDLRYKQIDLSFLFVFTIGGNLYDSSSKRQLGPVDEWNKTPQIYDRWQKPGDDAKYPRLTTDVENYGASNPFINTDQWLYDGSYLRLRNIILGYTFKREAIKRLKLQSLRLTFTATNVLTFTKFPGLDPEIARDFENPADRNMSPNITYLTPPQEQSYLIGLNMTF